MQETGEFLAGPSTQELSQNTYIVEGTESDKVQDATLMKYMKQLFIWSIFLRDLLISKLVILHRDYAELGSLIFSTFQNS